MWRKRLQHKLATVVRSRWSVVVLGVVSFAESSFFPLPPDALLIPMTLMIPRHAWRYATLTTATSVLGGLLGYWIGHALMDVVGYRIIDFYHLREQFSGMQDLFLRYDIWAVAIAGFTPIPYKLFTIASGVFAMHVPSFVVAYILSRGARFFLVSGLLRYFGKSIRKFLDRWFGWMTLLFVVLLALGYFILFRA